MQYRFQCNFRLLIESQFFQFFLANSRHVWATQGHLLVYMMVSVNCYAAL
jgi:hypothetical protein